MARNLISDDEWGFASRAATAIPADGNTDPAPYSGRHHPRFASHALPPQDRIDLRLIERQSDPTSIGTAGDPGREWREQDRGRRAVWEDDAPVRLGNLRAEEELDLFAEVMEFARDYHRDQRVVAYAVSRGLATVEAARRGDVDDAGRAMPAGRLLGIQPASPATAARNLDTRLRNVGFQDVRAAVPEWQAASDDDAAALMAASLRKYRAGAYAIDSAAKVVPPHEPDRTWFLMVRDIRKAKIDLSVDHLASILALPRE